MPVPSVPSGTSKTPTWVSPAGAGGGYAPGSRPYRPATPWTSPSGAGGGYAPGSHPYGPTVSWISPSGAGGGYLPGSNPYGAYGAPPTPGPSYQHVNDFYDPMVLAQMGFAKAAAERDWADAQTNYSTNVGLATAAAQKLAQDRGVEHARQYSNLLSQIAAANLARSGVRQRRQDMFEYDYGKLLDNDRAALTDKLAGFAQQRDAVRRALQNALEQAAWANSVKGMTNAVAYAGGGSNG